jgi:hypothetical protein
VLLLLAACGSPATPPPAAPAAPVPTATCYLGQGTASTKDGVQVRYKVARRRTMDPAASTMREEIAMENVLGRIEVVCHIVGDTFTIEDEGFTARGTLVLAGPWQVTSWQTHSQYDDGTSVDTSGTVTTTGMVIRQEKHDPDGERRTEESYERMDCADFEAKAMALSGE